MKEGRSSGDWFFEGVVCDAVEVSKLKFGCDP
jgi:hypothetical protein